MSADDKKRGSARVIYDFFIRYGAGAHHLQKVTRAKAWNLVAWILIALGTIGWAFFLAWKP